METNPKQAQYAYEKNGRMFVLLVNCDIKLDSEGEGNCERRTRQNGSAEITEADRGFCLAKGADQCSYTKSWCRPSFQKGFLAARSRRPHTASVSQQVWPPALPGGPDRPSAQRRKNTVYTGGIRYPSAGRFRAWVALSAVDFTIPSSQAIWSLPAFVL